MGLFYWLHFSIFTINLTQFLSLATYFYEKEFPYPSDLNFHWTTWILAWA